MPPPLEAECLEIHDTLRTLLATLGYPLFEPLIKRSREAMSEAGGHQVQPSEEEADGEVFFCTGSGADGKGRYTDDGFVVLQGSTGRVETTGSFNPHNARLREALFEKGILSRRGDRIFFERDHLFRKPSPAAACLMGRPANGMIEWKNSSGTSLGDVIRQGW